MKTRLLLVVCVLAAASLAAGCADSDPYNLKDLPAPPPESSSAATDTGQPAGKVAPSKMGQPASVGTWLLIANKEERTAEAGGVKAKDGKEMLVITADLTNGGALDEDTHPSYFVLVGPDGAEHTVVESDDPAFINTMPEPVVAGERREVFLLYSVDKGDGPFQLRFLPMTEQGKSEPAVLDVE